MVSCVAIFLIQRALRNPSTFECRQWIWN